MAEQHTIEKSVETERFARGSTLFTYKFVSLARRPIFKENRTHVYARSWHESRENKLQLFHEYLLV